MENDRILFYDAIYMTVYTVYIIQYWSYGELWNGIVHGGINNIFGFASTNNMYWYDATYTRDAIYLDFMSYRQYGFNRYGNSMNWTGSIKGFYYQHTGIVLSEDTYEGATGGKIRTKPIKPISIQTRITTRSNTTQETISSPFHYCCNSITNHPNCITYGGNI